MLLIIVFIVRSNLAPNSRNTVKSNAESRRIRTLCELCDSLLRSALPF
jgi:hypothetical protein